MFSMLVITITIAAAFSRVSHASSSSVDVDRLEHACAARQRNLHSSPFLVFLRWQSCNMLVLAFAGIDHLWIVPSCLDRLRNLQMLHDDNTRQFDAQTGKGSDAWKSESSRTKAYFCASPRLKCGLAFKIVICPGRFTAGIFAPCCGHP